MRAFKIRSVIVNQKLHKKVMNNEPYTNIFDNGKKKTHTQTPKQSLL